MQIIKNNENLEGADSPDLDVVDTASSSNILKTREEQIFLHTYACAAVAIRVTLFVPRAKVPLFVQKAGVPLFVPSAKSRRRPKIYNIRVIVLVRKTD